MFPQSFEDVFTKIDNMLDYQDDVTALDEAYIIQKLDGKDDDTVLRLKAKLYLKRSDMYRNLAKTYSEKALNHTPNNKESHYLYLSSVNGVMTDWNYYNKHDIIAFYRRFVDKNPKNT